MRISIKWTMREPPHCTFWGYWFVFYPIICSFSLDLVNPSYSVPLVNIDTNWKCFGTNLYFNLSWIQTLLELVSVTDCALREALLSMFSDGIRGKGVVCLSNLLCSLEC